jgi:uncharacterized repeat protein (TIGR01451 family)
MKENRLRTHSAGGASLVRSRILLLVMPALLVVSAAAGASAPAFADNRGSDGAVTVTADRTLAAPGTVVVYTITLRNGSQAGVVTVINNLPPHTTLLDAPDCTPRNGGSVSCSFPMFPYDEISTEVSVQIDSDINCNARLRDAARVHGWASSSVDVDVDCGAP